MTTKMEIASYIKVWMANLMPLGLSFIDGVDIGIKIFAFLFGSIYTIQRIVYNYEERKEKKKDEK
jgi:hypothetical protein